MHTLWILLGFNVGLFSVIVLVMLLLSWGELRIHIGSTSPSRSASSPPPKHHLASDPDDERGVQAILVVLFPAAQRGYLDRGK
uniref:Uncharacterized protein n=1 Tax=Oryza barthii TaxID=65489 RepID=A0A0D3F5X7_9ORYZ